MMSTTSRFGGALVALLLVQIAPQVLSFAPPSSATTSLVRSLTSRPTFAAASPSKQQWGASSSSRLYMSDAAIPPASTPAPKEEEEAAAVVYPAGTATVSQLIFNLVKGIVGAGVLSLPAGIAAWANAPSAVFPAVAMITIIGALSGYGFALIGRCCAYTNTRSYRDAWSKTVSQNTSWIPAVAVTFKTIAAILAYSMILGDTFVSLLATVGYTVSKPIALVGLTGGVLLPLCLLKNLASLAPFSLVGSLGMVYTAVAMAIRYASKSYAVGGKFAKDCAPALQPAFGAIGAKGVLTPSAAILVGMLSTAYMAHFNAPKVRYYYDYCYYYNYIVSLGYYCVLDSLFSFFLSLILCMRSFTMN
jgi:hypothetical protein